MQRIDVHAHHLPSGIVDALRTRRDPPRIVASPSGDLIDLGSGFAYPLFPQLIDPDAQLRAMDRDGIDVAVVGLTPVGLEALEPADAVALARQVNDELALLSERTASRLSGLAALPLRAPEAAVEELERSNRPGLCGAQLPSNVAGRSLDDPSFADLFAAAAELGMPLVLHPAPPVESATLRDYGLVSTLGFLYETTTAAVRLVMSGIFERHPTLRLVLPHAGSVIPYILARIDYETRLLGSWGLLGTPPSEQLRLLWADSVCLWPAALRLALEIFGSDRVMFGTDEPFWKAADGIDAVAQLRPDGVDLDAIYRTNAERAFGLRLEPEPADLRKVTQ